METYKMVCKHCRSDNITQTCDGRWNFERQSWILSDTWNNYYCHECDGEAKVEKIKETCRTTEGTKSITITWDTSDVQEVRPDLTDDQAWEVLCLAKSEHDANIGISWDTLDYWADYLYPVDNDAVEHDAEIDQAALDHEAKTNRS